MGSNPTLSARAPIISMTCDKIDLPTLLGRLDTACAKHPPVLADETHRFLLHNTLNVGFSASILECRRSGSDPIVDMVSLDKTTYKRTMRSTSHYKNEFISVLVALNMTASGSENEDKAISQSKQ